MTIVTIETANVPSAVPKKSTPSFQPSERGERLDELDLEDEAVDRRPEREDEPPARGRQDEADAAALQPEDRADDDADDAVATSAIVSSSASAFADEVTARPPPNAPPTTAPGMPSRMRVCQT